MLPLDRRTALVLGLSLASFVVAMSLAWGFTVDDALISTRVAHHLASGEGYRFNTGGEIQDAVTPLGWAPLLAPWSAASTWQGLVHARWLGVLLTVITALALGIRLGSEAGLKRLSVLVPAGLCLPLGAWQVSGMETPLITLLCTFALFPTKAGLACSGIAAALRPELTPWALAFALLRPAEDARSRGKHLALVVAAPLLVFATRSFLFGHPAPLSVFAKPSDVDHGLQYVLGGLRLLGLPILLVGYASWKRLPSFVSALALALGVHCTALIAAGGDWMALFRLFVPVLPATLWVGAELAQVSKGWAVGVRTALASSICLLLLVSKGPDARGVWSQRQRLITEAKSLLEDSKNVGSLDVGWVGAATDQSVTDFAGVTDRLVALQAGGHTSKQLPRDFLERRQVDALVLLLAPGQDVSGLDPTQTQVRDWRTAQFARQVEYRVSRMNGASDFVPVGVLLLQGTTQHYLILRKLKERFAHR